MWDRAMCRKEPLASLTVSLGSIDLWPQKSHPPELTCNTYSTVYPHTLRSQRSHHPLMTHDTCSGDVPLTSIRKRKNWSVSFSICVRLALSLFFFSFSFLAYKYSLSKLDLWPFLDPVTMEERKDVSTTSRTSHLYWVFFPAWRVSHWSVMSILT